MNLSEKTFATHGKPSKTIDPRSSAPKKSEEGKQYEIAKLVVKANKKYDARIQGTYYRNDQGS